MGALVIVESPAKARRIQEMLGGELHRALVARATSGTCRTRPPSCRRTSSTPRSAAPSASTPQNHFKAVYVVTDASKVRPLKDALKSADELLLATDEDREGEAIAWHLVEVLRPDGARAPDGLPRDHPPGDRPRPRPRRGTSTTTSSTPRRPAGSSTGSSASTSRRCCGASSPARAPRAASSPSRCASSSSASASASRSARRPGGASTPPSQAPGRASTPGWPSSTARRSPTARTSTSAGRSRPRPSARVLVEDDAALVVAGLEAATLTVAAVTSTPRTERPRPAVHHLVAADRGLAQARLVARTGRCASPRSSTRQGWITYMRTDSTTLSSRGDRRGAVRGADPLRPRVRARRAAALRQEGPQRPGGPRGDPPRGLLVPLDRRRRRRALSSDGARLYELIWKRTVASEMVDARLIGEQIRLDGRARPTPPARSRAGRSRCARPASASCSRASAAPTSRAATTPTRSSPTKSGCCPSSRRGRAVDVEAVDGGLARDQAAGAVHRGDARAAPRGARDRPAEHVRERRQGHQGPRLRVEEGHRAHPVVHGVRRHEPARALLRRARRLRVHRGDGGRPRRDRERREGPRRVAAALLLRRRGRHDRARAARAAPRDRGRDRPRPALDLHDPDRPGPRGESTSSCASAATARRCSAARSAGRCPPRPSPTPSPSSARSSCWPRAPATRGRRRPRDRPHRGRAPGPLRPLRPARDDRGGRGQAEDRLAVPVR